MKTADFIKRNCVGETCPPYFDGRYGCRAYDGEECDAAFHWAEMAWAQHGRQNQHIL